MRQVKRKTTRLLFVMLAVLSGCVFKPGGAHGGAGSSHDSDMDGVDTPPETDDDGSAVVDEDDKLPELDAGDGSLPDASSAEPDAATGGDDEPVIMETWPGDTASTADREDAF